MNKVVSSLDLSIYLVTDADMCHAAGRTVAQTVAEAVAGGVTCVQLRCKDAESLDFFNEVMEVADAVADSVTLLINDRVDVFLAARQAGATVAGVHVGQTDLPVALVRKLIVPRPLQMTVQIRLPGTLTATQASTRPCALPSLRVV